MLSMNDNTNKISNILQQVRLLKNELDAVTGEDFNIFSILRIKHKEVKTHTPMLAELLDPHGSHRQGAAFLKLFLKICIGDQDYTDLETFRVRSEERTDRGQFDILIEKQKEICIVIENKIYAGDQPHQLNNYYQDAKENKFNQIKLIYLTLDGSEPSEVSLKGENGQDSDLNVICISYRVHIISWLEECMKLQEVQRISPIREILFQYRDLLNELTGQPTNTGYSMKLKNILEQDKNHELIPDLEDMILEFKVHLQYEFWEELKKQILGLPEVGWHDTQQDEKHVPSKENIRNFYTGSRERDLYQIFHLGTAWKQYDLALDTGIEYWRNAELDEIYFAFILLKNGEHVDWKKINWLKNPAAQLGDGFMHDDYLHIWKYSKRGIGFPVKYPNPVVDDLLNNREKVVEELVSEIKKAINQLKEILKK